MHTCICICLAFAYGHAYASIILLYMRMFCIARYPCILISLRIIHYRCNVCMHNHELWYSSQQPSIYRYPDIYFKLIYIIINYNINIILWILLKVSVQRRHRVHVHTSTAVPRWACMHCRLCICRPIVHVFEFVHVIYIISLYYKII